MNVSEKLYIGSFFPPRPYGLRSLFFPALLIFAAGCHRSTPVTPEPHFGNLTPMSGRLFTAYFSPDPRTRPDTVEFSWDHPGINFGSIRVNAVSDSGDEHIALTGTVIAAGASRATLRWVPGIDSLHFGYFGFKKFVLELSDEETERAARSDTFQIFGPHPFVLESPAGGERYFMNDSIAVKYQINTDRISNIRVFFGSDSMADWIEITGTTTRTSDASPPLRSFTTIFVPRTWENIIAANPGVPFRFLLRDYDSPLPISSMVSNDIFIE